VQPDRRRTNFDPKAPFLLTPDWDTCSLRNLCCILWELRVILTYPSSALPDSYVVSTTRKGPERINNTPLVVTAQHINYAFCLAVVQARKLTVVLYEPFNVVVPLTVAASFPADALGRCALTRAAVADRFLDAAPKPDDPERRWDPEERQQWAWLAGLLPQRKRQDVAEVDGAAAMSAAVPAHVSSFLQLQADVRGRPYEDWSDVDW
jgi:hypothetical protein